MPFIIDDKRRSRCLRGIKEWHDDRFEMIDVVIEAQSRFEAQIELQRLHVAGQFFAPVSYQEGYLTMKMNAFMTALQTHLANQQPSYPNNAERILEVLFDAYNESSGFDNAAIKADFKELYRLMNGKQLKEIDEIICTVCILCRDHEKAGFIEGITVGMSLAKELYIP